MHCSRCRIQKRTQSAILQQLVNARHFEFILSIGTASVHVRGVVSHQVANETAIPCIKADERKLFSHIWKAIFL